MKRNVLRAMGLVLLALAMATRGAPPAEAGIIPGGYLCRVRLAPLPPAYGYGNFGTVFVAVYSGKECAGTPLVQGYLLTTGSTWLNINQNYLFSEQQLSSNHSVLTQALLTGRRVDINQGEVLFGTNRQILSVVLRAD